MSKALEQVRGINIRVEVLIERNGRKLSRPRADEHGYYEIPLAALGRPTRNRTLYPAASFVDQITNENSQFHIMLADGGLYGEYGHPDVTGMALPAAVNRMSKIDESRVSHHFRSVHTGKELEDGGLLLNGAIRPHGPYGKHLQENLETPTMNTAFSLRAITDARIQGGYSVRNMKKLVTFDSVLAGGYAEASKRFMPSVESLADIDGFEMFDIAVPGRDTAVFSEIALENFSNHELNEIFGAKTVQIFRKEMTVIQGGEGLIDDTGRLLSTYDQLVRLR